METNAGVREIYRKMIPVMYEFTVTYTEDIVRRSVHVVCIRVIRRLFDWKLCTAALVTIVCLVLSHSSHELSWLEGAVGTLLGTLVGFAIILYRTRLRQSLGRLRRMKTATGHFLVTDETLTVSTDLGSSTVPWATFAGMSEHADFWLLNTTPNAGLTLPTGSISPEALQFIRNKIKPSTAIS
jgi:hypothetical protein